MSDKSINIEKIENKDGGTINFYVGDEKFTDVDKKSVSIAAVDIGSLPLYGEVAITPYGKQHHRVSCRVTEQRNNQTLYEKYLVYKTKESARTALNKIVDVLEEIKDEAEINLRHSVYLMPKIVTKLSNMSSDAEIGYHDTIDDSIKRRFDNNQFDSKETPEPYGWLGEEIRSTYTQGVASNIAQIIGAPSQYSNPGRTGVMANKISGIVKTSSKTKINIINSSYINIFLKLSGKKHFSSGEAREIGEKIGIDWDKVKFSVGDFKKGLEIEVEHDDNSNTDVVKNDSHEYETIGKIAWAHLKESPEYYKELDKMENNFDK